ncbi:MAG TPA: hypothetical protein VF188_17310 [Longimicrobiales bacterium]
MLRAGILIIGSLYWDDTPIRNAWRRERLAADRAARVVAPIRYGRQSDKREQTFSMVFSTRCYAPDCGLGTGLVVPCVNDVATADDLVEEAMALWRAEAEDAAADATAADWGAVALLVNPRGAAPASLLGTWRRWYRSQPQRPQWDRTFDDPAPMNPDGFLYCHWPVLAGSDEPADFDILLATPTLPRVLPDDRGYPAGERIARAWIEHDDGHEAYFFRNVASGIRTFQDAEIWETLRGCGRPWAEREECREAIRILDAERGTAG